MAQCGSLCCLGVRVNSLSARPAPSRLPSDGKHAGAGAAFRRSFDELCDSLKDVATGKAAQVVASGLLQKVDAQTNTLSLDDVDNGWLLLERMSPQAWQAVGKCLESIGQVPLTVALTVHPQRVRPALLSPLAQGLAMTPQIEEVCICLPRGGGDVMIDLTQAADAHGAANLRRLVLTSPEGGWGSQEAMPRVTVKVPHGVEVDARAMGPMPHPPEVRRTPGPGAFTAPGGPRDDGKLDVASVGAGGSADGKQAAAKAAVASGSAPPSSAADLGHLRAAPAHRAMAPSDFS